MGIKHFFYWFKTQFSKHITRKKYGEKLSEDIDNLMIDMNGLFHNSTQKIYEYGSYKPQQRLMTQRPPKNPLQLERKVFQDVCYNIEKIFKTVNPKKRLILCVDGPAPQAKQNQQRQRRFKSALERTDMASFDSNCLTPGTKFMDNLSKYIDWYIKKKISEDEEWKNIEVIFSNEKSPGEGEHKIINYIRKYGDRLESYCIHGMDADLIMLSLATHIPNFYIVRDDMYNISNYFLVKILNIRPELSEILRWKGEYNSEWAINDFVFLCFMVGNDFLSHIPALEIIENGIDIIIETYKDVCINYGHITHNIKDSIVFQKTSLKMFLKTISTFEKDILEKKMGKKEDFFPDELINSSMKNQTELDIKLYRKKYSEKHFSDKNIETVCHDYLEGLAWVLSYYTRGVPNWRWYYTHHYAPGAEVLAEHIDTFIFPKYDKTTSILPFQQLLSVLPPKSASLIPFPLNKLLIDIDSPLKEFCPDTFEVDLSGCRQEWEGKVILPVIDFSILRDAYFKKLGSIDKRDIVRNKLGKSNIYTYSYDTGLFKHFYGNIENYSVKIKNIDI